MGIDSCWPDLLVSAGLRGRMEVTLSDITYYRYLPAGIFDCAIWKSSQSGVYELLAATNGKGLGRISTLDMKLR
jgi:hypothetical protein